MALRLLAQGCPAASMEEHITDRYYFPDWQLTADDLAQLLNACGRTDQEGVGVALALRDARAMESAQRLRREYKQAVLEGMREVVSQGVTRTEGMQWFVSGNPSLSGVLCGLTMQFLGGSDRPTIALSFQGDQVRVSSRANFRLVEKGVDLATALRECAAKVGGQGGGHAVASGATVAKGREREFLRLLDETLVRQMSPEPPPNP